ncbi:MAG: EamA family transporter [Microthrixaceae bacterium]
MTVLLAALSALTFGTGDFLGGLSSKRMSAAVATITAQFVGLVLILAVCLVVTGNPTGRDFWMGALAGAAGGGGLTMFYWAMSVGPMSVIAPVSALLNAFVPVLAGFVKGERPAPLALLGIIVAVPAILLISREPSDPERLLAGTGPGDGTGAPRKTMLSRIGGLPVVAGAVAGVCFGFFFVFLNEASNDSGLWPIVSARATAVVVVTAAALVTRVSMPTKTGLLLAAGAGCLDVVGNTFYLLATRRGLIILVGVVSAMYPASTVLLARSVLKERMARHQILGLVIAALAVTLIALAA